MFSQPFVHALDSSSFFIQNSPAVSLKDLNVFNSLNSQLNGTFLAVCKD